jgi:hypothetical protein
MIYEISVASYMHKYGDGAKRGDSEYKYKVLEIF